MSDEWNVYRTRFLARAKQLTQSLVVTDSRGREHYGKPGDYLVESSDGVLRVAPREIFEDLYVMLEDTPRHSPSANLQSRSGSRSLGI